MAGFERWMEQVGKAGLDGWLVADFRRNNPILTRLLDLESGILTRRCFLWIPAAGSGEPTILGSRVDGHAFQGLGCPVALYAGFEDMGDSLQQLLPPGGRVAMEYVERGALPTVSRVDAGLIELVRSWRLSVVSSALLVAGLEVWDRRQQELHRRAARGVDEARRLALRRCADALRQGEPLTEGELSRFILRVFTEQGLAMHDSPDVAVGAHAADPHYSTGEGDGTPIGRDAVLLIDLWAKVRDVEDAPYADSTWMAYTGSAPAADLVRVFEAVRTARDAALEAAAQGARDGTAATGREVDRVARASIAQTGLERYLMHRTGHSLGIDHVQGMGTNLDDVEFPDDRPLLPWSGFTVEPGLYLPDRFGVRMEVSALLTPDGLEVTTESQTELTLLAASASS